MPALTQCWFTRAHIPAGRKHKEADGCYHAHCRYCGKSITSWAKGQWYLADGFNIGRLRDSTGGHFLYVIDVIDEFIVARYPVQEIEDPAALRAFKEELRKQHGIGQPGCTLELRDSGSEASVH